jgi:hypothetical protein
MTWLKRLWTHFWLWVDWHGRLATVAIILISVGGAGLVRWILLLWTNVPRDEVWIVVVLVLAIFLCTLSLAGIKLRPRSDEEKAKADSVIDARTKRTIYEINFDYLPALPTKNGWDFVYGLETNPSFNAPQDDLAKGGLELFCPYKTYKIKHIVPEPYATLTDELELAIKYGRDAMFWVEVNVTSRDGISENDCRLLKIVVGHKPPFELKDYPKEHVVSVMPDPLQNGWVGFRLRLSDLVAAAVGKLGYVFCSIKTIQLRGCISISPIKFLSPVPMEAQQISK